MAIQNIGAFKQALVGGGARVELLSYQLQQWVQPLPFLEVEL